MRLTVAEQRHNAVAALQQFSDPELASARAVARRELGRSLSPEFAQLSLHDLAQLLFYCLRAKIEREREQPRITVKDARRQLRRLSADLKLYKGLRLAAESVGAQGDVERWRALELQALCAAQPFERGLSDAFATR